MKELYYDISLDPFLYLFVVPDNAWKTKRKRNKTARIRAKPQMFLLPFKFYEEAFIKKIY